MTIQPKPYHARPLRNPALPESIQSHFRTDKITIYRVSKACKTPAGIVQELEPLCGYHSKAKAIERALQENISLGLDEPELVLKELAIWEQFFIVRPLSIS